MNLYAKILFQLIFLIITNLTSQNIKQIYLAMDDHTDYMWSTDEITYQHAFCDMLDYYIDMADSSCELEPFPYQSKFTCDGSYWMWAYEKNRPPQEFQRLIEKIKSGHITVPSTPLTICYGAMPAEAVIRSMYYAGKIERMYNVSFPMAAPMEDQTMPAGVGSLWAGAGAKYCWMGICGCASRINFHKPRAHEIYWWKGLDNSRLLIKWNSLNDSDSLGGWANESLGGYAEARRPYEAIDYVEKNSGFKSRYPYNIIGIFGKGWDDVKTMSIEFIDVAKQLTTEKRHVYVSNEIDFFQDFEKIYGADLPTYCAAFGNEWDLYPASMAGLTARMKNAIEKLRSAEALATLVILQGSSQMASLKASRDLAFMNMGLFWNHDWTADGPVSKANFEKWARGIVCQVESYVNSLYEDARLNLGNLIKKDKRHTTVYVFNPLGWNRTDVADIEYKDQGPVLVVDKATEEQVPSQFFSMDGKQYLRWLARDVPSLGYKVYEIKEGHGKSFYPCASFKENVLENDYYRLIITKRGAITSLIDKKNGNNEYVDTINGRALNDLGEGIGNLEINNIGPVSATITVHCATPLKHITNITLYKHIDRIDIKNQITQNFGSAGDDPPCWTFSFNIDYPEIWHEEVGAVIKAKLLSSGGHYSPTHARYDWLTLNHFANIRGTNKSVTLSNQDCCFFKTGSSIVQTLDESTPQISLLIGGQIDGAKLGIPNQGGDSLFTQRFALRTGKIFNQTEDMQFALEHQNPLVTGFVTGNREVYPGDLFSLFSISDKNILLWAVKPAEDIIEKKTLVTRFWNMNQDTKQFYVKFPHHKVVAGKQITHVETPIENALISNNHLHGIIAPNQMKSYKVDILPFIK